ncbi:MAG: hypothetical protein ACOC1K_05160 [Nanoarchaeota archaeon]
MKIIEKIDTFMNTLDGHKKNDNGMGSEFTGDTKKSNKYDDIVTLSEAAKPEFKKGNKVLVDGKKEGKIIKVDEFDPVLKQYIYDVKIDGKIES